MLGPGVAHVEESVCALSPDPELCAKHAVENSSNALAIRLRSERPGSPY
jgi:hypothetical protein